MIIKFLLDSWQIKMITSWEQSTESILPNNKFMITIQNNINKLIKRLLQKKMDLKLLKKLFKLSRIYMETDYNIISIINLKKLGDISMFILWDIFLLNKCHSLLRCLLTIIPCKIINNDIPSIMVELEGTRAKYFQ